MNETHGKTTVELIKERYQVVSGIFSLVVIGGSTALYHHNKENKIGNDLDCVISSEQILGFCDKIIRSVGGRMLHDYEFLNGFTVRRSYLLKNGYKVEFFIDPISGSRTSNSEFVFCSPETVWAARRYYASRASAVSNKYAEQIIWNKVHEAAANSPEPYKVGAVYIAPDGTQVAGFNHHRDYNGHAEITAIRLYEKQTFKKAKGGLMYCTWSPCSGCKKTLEALGIKSVYLNEYLGKL